MVFLASFILITIDNYNRIIVLSYFFCTWKAAKQGKKSAAASFSLLEWDGKGWKVDYSGDKCRQPGLIYILFDKILC